MEWLNLHTSVLDSPEVVGEDPTNRATWLFLLRYCVGQENGGVIKNAAQLGDRKWQQMVRVTRREVRRNSDLWTWVDDDLIVHAYPTDKEQQVKNMRELGRSTSAAKKAAAKANGSKGGRPSTNTEKNPTKNPTGKPTKNPPKTHIREGKGRERKGREHKLATLAYEGGDSAHLPDGLNSPAMKKIWPEWRQHWAETFAQGKPMPEQTAYAQLSKLSAIGPERAVIAIQNAIIRGLREPAEPLPARPSTSNQPEKGLSLV